MSAREERDALTPPTALYDHALRLLRDSPGGVPRRRGCSPLTTWPVDASQP
ncbi:hypothetical protein [Streptomyces sp. NPDC052292]|uniref:hypothetical protein n=1 Tax=Streptomyces sp. NPDC052292 TaxID=3155053 RepID=UPI0034247F99